MIYAVSLVMPFLVGLRAMFHTMTLEVPSIFIGGYVLYRLRCIGVSRYYLWVPLVALRILIGDNYTTYKW